MSEDYKSIIFSANGKVGDFLLLSKVDMEGQSHEHESFLLHCPSVSGIEKIYGSGMDEALRESIGMLCNTRHEGIVSIPKSVYLHMLQQKRCLLPMESECETIRYGELLLPKGI